ncbi:MAG: DUF1223 domain-containing protein [Pseudomonadota bacterium]
MSHRPLFLPSLQDRIQTAARSSLLSGFLILGLLTIVFPSAVKAQQFSSTVEQVPLIELYTSEGCSSCPPADRWLSGLKQDEGLWTRFVPIAFHVDYWDYIGWKDRFANREYSQRQRRYAHEFGESTVYTPGLRKAGAEWRSWRLFGDPRAKGPEQVGILNLYVEPDGSFSANFDLPQESGGKAAGQSSLQLTVALLGQNLVSQVSRGENRGRELSHDFVVLGLTTVTSDRAGQQNADSKSISWSGKLPEASVQAMDYAVAAWVTRGGSLRPLQSTGGDLNSNYLSKVIIQ